MSPKHRLALSKVQDPFANVRKKPSPRGRPFHSFSPSSPGARRSRFPSRPTLEQASCEQRSPPFDPQRRSAIASLRRPSSDDVLLPQFRKRVFLKPCMKFGFRLPVKRRLSGRSVHHHKILGGEAVNQRNGLSGENYLGMLRRGPYQPGKDFDGIRMKAQFWLVQDDDIGKVGFGLLQECHKGHNPQHAVRSLAGGKYPVSAPFAPGKQQLSEFRL